MAAQTNSGLDFIDSLLTDNNISLREVSDFAKANKEELQKTDNIFKRQTERDIKLCLAVFRLLSREDYSEICKNFCTRYGVQTGLDDIFFKENKLLLIASFIENPAFFAMACNICGFIKAEIAMSKQEEEQEEEQQWQEVIVVFLWQISAKSASDAGMDLKLIGKKEINQDGIKGELQVRANNKDESGQIQFSFKFNKYSQKPPYYLVVRYTTDKDKTEHTAEIIKDYINTEDEELEIKSEIYSGICYTGGITITSIKARKNV